MLHQSETIELDPDITANLYLKSLSSIRDSEIHAFKARTQEASGEHVRLYMPNVRSVTRLLAHYAPLLHHATGPEPISREFKLAQTKANYTALESTGSETLASYQYSSTSHLLHSTTDTARQGQGLPARKDTLTNRPSTLMK